MLNKISDSDSDSVQKLVITIKLVRMVINVAIVRKIMLHIQRSVHFTNENLIYKQLE